MGKPLFEQARTITLPLLDVDGGAVTIRERDILFTTPIVVEDENPETLIDLIRGKGCRGVRIELRGGFVVETSLDPTELRAVRNKEWTKRSSMHE